MGKKKDKKKKKKSNLKLDDLSKSEQKESTIEPEEEIGVEDKGDLTSVLNQVTNFNETPKKRALTVYIDEEVAKKFDTFGLQKGKGAKSELVNNLLKSALEVYGE